MTPPTNSDVTTAKRDMLNQEPGKTPPLDLQPVPNTQELLTVTISTRIQAPPTNVQDAKPNTPSKTT